MSLQGKSEKKGRLWELKRLAPVLEDSLPLTPAVCSPEVTSAGGAGAAVVGAVVTVTPSSYAPSPETTQQHTFNEITSIFSCQAPTHSVCVFKVNMR